MKDIMSLFRISLVRYNASITVFPVTDIDFSSTPSETKLSFVSSWCKMKVC